MRSGKRIGKKVVILLLVFFAAAIIYFLRPMNSGEDQGTAVYTAMESATLPVVYPQMMGREMAPLFGHMEEGAVTADRDSLLVLPEDRRLTVRIGEAWEVQSVSYEVRSMDMQHLVERTEVTGLDRSESGITAVLPIQNLLTEDTQYSLGIQLVLSDGSSVWYYARIMESNNSHVDEMLTLAEEFSLKTLDYEAAQDLTMYMESSVNADNSSFGNVTLKNSFTQITWGTLGVAREGEVKATLRELSGDLANIQLDYVVWRTSGEETERYAVSENFTMKWSTQRIYMMDYQREMNQFFTGDRENYSGKRILLGINSGDGIYGKTSSDQKTTAFVVNGELWAYDTHEAGGAGGLFSHEDARSILVFSFGAGENGDVRAENDSHGIEILDVDENGGIHFLVHGYMNRGGHEGETGICYYYYDAGKNILEERFFLPASENGETLAADLAVLAHKGANGILYLFMDGSVYGIDLTSSEYVVVASGLTDDKFSVSGDGSRLAWQENTGVYDSETISVMDLDTGEKRQISGDKGDACRLLGFVGNDCVYGVGTKGDYIMSNGRIMGLFLRKIEIVDREMNCVKSYEKEGSWISSASVEESRIHIENVRDKSGGFFAESTSDTLVCNADALPGKTDLIGWYASEEKGRIYFVQAPGTIGADDEIRSLYPEKMEVSGMTRISLESIPAPETMEYWAYGRGRYLGRYVSFSDGAEAAYDSMGFVNAGENDVIWIRGNKANSYYIRDYQTAVQRQSRNMENYLAGGTDSGNLMLELTGCTLNQALYFVGEGIPVLAYIGEGSGRYLVGYDQVSVRVYDPDTRSLETWDLDSAQTYFESAGNDYVCFVNLGN